MRIRIQTEAEVIPYNIIHGKKVRNDTTNDDGL